MTIYYLLEKWVNKYQFINGLKHNSIPLQSQISIPFSKFFDTQNQNSQSPENVLSILMPIYNYNKYINGFDGNVQMY